MDADHVRSYGGAATGFGGGGGGGGGATLDIASTLGIDHLLDGNGGGGAGGVTILSARKKI